MTGSPEHSPKPELPSTTGRANPVLMCVVLLMAAIPIAVCWIFFFGKLYGTVAFLILMALLLFGSRHWRRLSDARRSRLVDNLSGNPPSDDPRQMARWMR